MNQAILTALSGEAMRAFQQGDLAKTEGACTQALEIAPNEPFFLMMLGLVHGARGDFAPAKEALERANAGSPGNPAILSNLADILTRSGEITRGHQVYQAARRAFEARIRANPKSLDLRTELARLLMRIGAFDEAIALFREVVAAAPENGPAIRELAAALESTHRLDEAEAVARSGLARPDFATACGIVLARVAVRRQAADEALKAIKDTRVQGGLTPADATMLSYLEGQAFELKGDYRAAFAAFETANTAQAKLIGERFDDPASITAPARLHALAAHLKANAWPAWPKAVSGPAVKDHVFMVGFPRSGTTLLEQALDAHPNIRSLEEKDTLAAAFALLRKAGSLVAFFDGLKGETLDRLRADYWARVKPHAGGSLDGIVLVDKVPMNSAFLSVIAALFPESKIIFSVRDPRDVCVSAFQQQFGVNGVTRQFLTLGGAAALYDATMDAAFAARAVCKPVLHEVRYEALVSDTEQTLRAVFAFLDLPWDERVLAFQSGLASKPINTPSLRQVVEPIHAGAVGKWMRYRDALAPQLPVLAPWVARFGYSA